MRKKKQITKKAIIADGWKIIKSGKYDMGSTSSFGGWRTNGGLIKHNSVCHAALGSMVDTQVLYSYSRCKVDRNRPEYIAYIKWLLTTSPWGMNKVWAPKTSVTVAAKHGFLVTNTKLPANLIGNALVATRQPLEAWHCVMRWYEFVQAGVHPNVAWVFAEALGANVWWKASENNHEPLDIHQISVDGVAAFCHGRVVTPNQPFKVDGNYIPCAAVWEAKEYKKSGPFTNKLYKDFLDRTYPVRLAEGVQPSRRLFMLPIEKKGEFPDGNGARGWAHATLTRTKEQWLEIALAESERMFPNDGAKLGAAAAA